jgi:hypothetical protein
MLVAGWRRSLASRPGVLNWQRLLEARSPSFSVNSFSLTGFLRELHDYLSAQSVMLQKRRFPSRQGVAFPRNCRHYQLAPDRQGFASGRSRHGRVIAAG